MYTLIIAVGYLLAHVHGEDAVVKRDTISILNSETLPGNILPNFMFQQGSIEGGAVGVIIGGDIIYSNRLPRTYYFLQIKAAKERHALSNPMTVVEMIYLMVLWMICALHSFLI